ncbi:hypothetical protein GmHk_13G036515 [Glycine max]|nr:hypothetical protein GmHk_13G036515 [Glycine max]
MRYSAHFLSDEWLSLWPDSTQFVLDRDFSDHCPILLRSTTVDWGPRPFKVMDWWLKDKDFQKMVSYRWGNYHPSGWGGYALKLKLKFIKGCIRQWSLQNGSNASIISQDEVQLRKSLQEQLWSAALAYESMLRQKSRVKLIREGDRNSSYFHRIINRRRRVNAFQGLCIDGGWIHEPNNVKWEWKFQWRRNLFDHEVDMATAFMADIAEFQIQPASRDLLLWGLDTGGPYSTKAAYSFLKDGDSQIVTSSQSGISKFHLEQVLFLGDYSRTESLPRRRHVELPSYNCPLCDEEEETTSHIQYSCIKTRTLWWETMSWVNRVGPFSTEPRDHFKQFSLWSGKSSVDHRWQVLWVALSMTIWKHRNSMVFNNQNFCSEKVMDEALFHTWSWLNGMEKSSHSHFNQWSTRLKAKFWGLADSTFVILNLHLELEINCEKTRSLWWETMRWVNRVGSYSIDPKNHFLQFTQWNSKDSTNKRWEFLWLALSFSIWYHRNAKIFKNQSFTPEKVMDDALFHTWSWIKCMEKDFQMHFNFWSTNLNDVLS